MLGQKHMKTSPVAVLLVFTAMHASHVPKVMLPYLNSCCLLSQMGNAMVSLRRLSQYLVMEERRDTVQPLDRVGLDIEGGQFYWCEPPKTKKLDSVKGAPGQGKKRSLLSVFGGLKLRKGPAVGTGPAKDLGMRTMQHLVQCIILIKTLSSS